MSLWGVNDPIIWIEGEQYDLPTPYKRNGNLWRPEQADWKNLSRDINQRFWGFRVYGDLEWRHLNKPQNQAAQETLIKLKNIRECVLAPWGASAPRFRMVVQDHQSYYVDDYVRIDGLWILMISKKLYKKEIGPQEFYRASSVRSGRVHV